MGWTGTARPIKKGTRLRFAHALNYEGHGVFTDFEFVSHTRFFALDDEGRKVLHVRIPGWKVRPYEVLASERESDMNDRQATWRNVHHFTEADERKHDGHRVLVGPVYIPDADEQEVTMADAVCLVDGESFSAFEEELTERNGWV